MSASNTIRVMLLGIAFINSFALNTSVYNSEDDENNNFNKASLNRYFILDEAKQFLDDIQKSKRDIIKRNILDEKKVIKEIIYTKNLKRQQDALDTIVKLGYNLANNEKSIQDAIYAIRELNLNTQELNSLNKIPLKSSNYDELLKINNLIDELRFDLLDAYDKTYMLGKLNNQFRFFTKDIFDMTNKITKEIGDDVLVDDFMYATSESMNQMIESLKLIRPELNNYKDIKDSNTKNIALMKIKKVITDYKIGMPFDDYLNLNTRSSEQTISNIVKNVINNIDTVISKQEKIISIIKDLENKHKNRANLILNIQALQDDIDGMDYINHILPDLDLSPLTDASEIDSYIDILNKIDWIPSKERESMLDFVNKLKQLSHINIKIDKIDDFIYSPIYDYSYRYDDFIKIYQDAYLKANSDVQDYLNKIFNILKQTEHKAQQIKDIREKIAILKQTNADDAKLKIAFDKYKKIIFDNSATKTQESIFDALNAKYNIVADNVFNQNNQQKTKDLIMSTQNSLSHATKVLSSTLMRDTVRLNSELSINNRLAKLANPFNDNLQLANAIIKLKDKRFASSSDEVMALLVKEYLSRHSSQSNLYKSFIGGKVSMKNNKINPRIYGLSVGYDVLFDNILLGSSATYAKTKIDTSYVSSRADNYQLEVYARRYIKSSEIDLRASFGISNTNMLRMLNADGSTYTSSSSGKSINCALSLDYGYIFKISDGSFIKPIVGTSYLYSKHNPMKESGVFASNFSKGSTKKLSFKFAGEFRHYVDANYFYITPGIEKEIYKSSKDISISLANIDIPIYLKEKRNTYLTLQTGIDFALTNRLSANANFGVKTTRNESYYNGTIGVRWIF